MNNIARFLVKTSLAGVLLLSLLLMSGGMAALANGGPPDQEAFVPLGHTPHGTAQLEWSPTTDKLTVTVKVSGLQAGSVHPEHIHAGTSCASNGKILYTLNNVIADQAGNATTTTTIQGIKKGIPQSGWYLNVHNGPTLATPDEAIAITCGTIFNTDTSERHTQRVTTTLGTTPDANQNTTGFARLTLHGTTLRVRVAAFHLVPGSTHAVHIHAGQCERQIPGKVLYPLTTLTANAAGNATSETSIANVKALPANQWYINVHFSTNLSTQTGFDPIACGNVT